MCWALQLCDQLAVQQFLLGLAVFTFLITIVVAFAVAAYFEAKSKSPPFTNADIDKIINDVKRRAYERGRYEE